VLALYLHRGSFETVLADEDREQDPDRWCSHTPCGQEFCQILHQWLWNRRLAFGQQLTPSAMRLTEFAPPLVAPVVEVAPVVDMAPVVEATPVVEAALVVKGVSYGPPHWARRSWTSGFAGADFSLQPDGTLLCPAGHSLSVHERRPEPTGSLRVLYSARLCDCRPCLLKAQCQEALTTLKPRRVSAVFWPISVAPLDSGVPSPPPVDVSPPPLRRATAATTPTRSCSCPVGRLGTLSNPPALDSFASYPNRPSHQWFCPARRDGGTRGTTGRCRANESTTGTFPSELAVTDGSQCASFFFFPT
jgi:hypothetical protein